MAVTEQDYEQVRSRQAEARKLAETANLLGGRATSFGANVMDRVREARASRGISQLSTDIGAATGRLASEGPAIRERMATVNPLQVDVATSQARAAELANLASMADWQTATQGTLTDVIGAGTDRLKAMAAAKQAEAQTAAQEASDLIQMIQLKEAQEARAFQEMMAEQEMGLAREQFEWEKTKPTGGAGGDINEMITNAIIQSLLGGGEGGPSLPTPTEPKPTTRPTRRDVQYHSSRGEWVWDWETEDWYPVIY